MIVFALLHSGIRTPVCHEHPLGGNQPSSLKFCVETNAAPSLAELGWLNGSFAICLQGFEILEIASEVPCIYAV